MVLGMACVVSQYLSLAGMTGKVQTATVRDLNLFSTPLGQSYVCHEAQLLSMELQGARLEFNWVHLMPFGVNGTRFSAGKRSGGHHSLGCHLVSD